MLAGLLCDCLYCCIELLYSCWNKHNKIRHNFRHYSKNKKPTTMKTVIYLKMKEKILSNNKTRNGVTSKVNSYFKLTAKARYFFRFSVLSPLIIKFCLVITCTRPPLWSSGQSFWLEIQRSRVLFPALPDFLCCSGSGTGPTQPREVK